MRFRDSSAVVPLLVRGRREGRTLHTLDGRLAVAAQREGFAVPT
jgi:hypothetical protein